MVRGCTQHVGLDPRRKERVGYPGTPCDSCGNVIKFVSKYGGHRSFYCRSEWGQISTWDYYNELKRIVQ